MTERERLIRLLDDACFEACKKKNDDIKLCHYLADSLLENGVIVPLVKVGDTVWDNDYGRPESYIVTGLDIGKTMDDEVEHKELFVYCQNWNGSITFRFPASLFGKTVFLTREDAEKALEKKEGVNNG